jgi:hypothetical protein
MANVDEVHNLLRAVNEVTLKRMEEKEDRLRDILMAFAERLGHIEEKLGLPKG